ncbi:hypothetical protein DY000_02023298 [Brassica cretica]|uniref:Uncharacterized protein n=1 Tax=Brassica cretica TaxID=69181 RepID=A0ABQ7EJ50_BRACR|nr:hypothetical protein DY000_02023298 [Brassica cretica]
MTQETKTQYVTNSIIHGNAKVRSSPRHYGWRTISNDEELKERYCLEWWIKLLSAHGIDNYARVMYVMLRTGVRSESIIASLTHYSRESLKVILRGIKLCLKLWFYSIELDFLNVVLERFFFFFSASVLVMISNDYSV